MVLSSTTLKRLLFDWFWGSNGTVFISRDRQVLVTDSRYIIAAKQEVTGFEIVADRDELAVIAGIVRIWACLASVLKTRFRSLITTVCRQLFAGIDLLPQTQFVEALRMIKDEKEIATIRKACSISDQAFEMHLTFIKPGKNWDWNCQLLDFRMRELGAAGLSLIPF